MNKVLSEDELLEVIRKTVQAWTEEELLLNPEWSERVTGPDRYNAACSAITERMNELEFQPMQTKHDINNMMYCFSVLEEYRRTYHIDYSDAEEGDPYTELQERFDAALAQLKQEFNDLKTIA